MTDEKNEEEVVPFEVNQKAEEPKKPDLERVVSNVISSLNQAFELLEKHDLRIKLLEQRVKYEDALAEKAEAEAKD